MPSAGLIESDLTKSIVPQRGSRSVAAVADEERLRLKEVEPSASRDSVGAGVRSRERRPDAQAVRDAEGDHPSGRRDPTGGKFATPAVLSGQGSGSSGASRIRGRGRCSPALLEDEVGDLAVTPRVLRRLRQAEEGALAQKDKEDNPL